MVKRMVQLFIMNIMDIYELMNSIVSKEEEEESIEKGVNKEEY